jgi:hypothetical protein
MPLVTSLLCHQYWAILLEHFLGLQQWARSLDPQDASWISAMGLVDAVYDLPRY